MMTALLRVLKESNKFINLTPPSTGKSGSNTGSCADMLVFVNKWIKENKGLKERHKGEKVFRGLAGFTTTMMDM